MRGIVFRVGEVTGLSPFYSGVERAQQRVFRKILRPGDIAVDVGANWGLHSLYLSRLVGQSGRVIALEPLPLAFSELEWHAQKNRCANVTPLLLALSDSNGQTSFSPADSPCQGVLTAAAPSSTDRSRSIVVQTRTLDSLLAEMGVRRLRLVKIDVEGAESRVLDGAAQTMKNLKPYFVIELHTPEQDVAVARRLAENGYALGRVAGPPILRTDVGWPNRDGVWGTLLASPPGNS